MDFFGPNDIEQCPSGLNVIVALPEWTNREKNVGEFQRFESATRIGKNEIDTTHMDNIKRTLNNKFSVKRSGFQLVIGNLLNKRINKLWGIFFLLQFEKLIHSKDIK